MAELLEKDQLVEISRTSVSNPDAIEASGKPLRKKKEISISGPHSDLLNPPLRVPENMYFTPSEMIVHLVWQ